MCSSRPKMPPAPPPPAPAPPAPEPLTEGIKPTDVAQSRLAAYGGMGSSLLKRLRIPLGGTGSS